MKIKFGSFSLAFLMLMILGACTPYKPNGILGGYSDLQLNKNTYRVSFRGNGFTSEERVKNFLLLRSAQLAKENGYNYFIILDGYSKDKISTYTTPTHISTNSYGNYDANFNHNHLFGNFTGNDDTTIYQGQMHIIHRYKDTALVRLLNSNKKYPNAYDASIILKEFSKTA